MTKKIKLALEQLRKELSILNSFDLYNCIGGDGSGFYSGDGSFESVVSFLESLGVPFVEDSTGNYFIGSGILIDEVTVQGYYNSGNNGSGVGWPDSGDENSGITGSGMLEQILAFLNGNGIIVEAGPGGGIRYTSSGSSTSGTQDPWERDINNNLIITPTNSPHTTIDYTLSNTIGIDKVKLTLEEVIIKGAKNEDIIAYRVVKYTDENGVDHFDVPDKYKANCHGSAMGLELWFHDPYTPDENNIDTVHEDLAFQEMVDGYSTNFSNSTVISYYNGSVLAHSIRRNSATGEIWSKTDIGEMKKYSNISDFYNDPGNEMYNSMTRKYFKF